MHLQDVINHLEALAPLHLAEAWDNVGLLVGDPQARVRRVLLAIDATPAVLAEAAHTQTQLLLSYHPLTLKGVRRLGPRDALFVAAKNNVAVYSPHTALDAAHAGTNDTLADLAGVGTRTPLRPHRPAQGLHKLTAYVPPKAFAAVTNAVFDAGAGDFGAYSRCSFFTEGHGSFVPGPDASPDEGKVGEQAEVPERRLEVLMRPQDSARVLAALRAAHPYEEPVYDVTELLPAPADVGQGRVGELRPDATAPNVTALAARLRTAGGLRYVQHTTTPELAAGPVRRVAFVAGAGDGLLDDVVRAAADVFVTGELRHHTVLACHAAGVRVVLLGHDGSERPALAGLRDRLAGRLEGVEVNISAADRRQLAAVV